VLSVVSYQVEVSALGLSLIQRSPTDCGLPECDREASLMRGTGLTIAVCAMYTNSKIFVQSSLVQPQGNGQKSTNHSLTEGGGVGGAGVYYTIKDL
jgi:hypothetical protein